MQHKWIRPSASPLPILVIQIYAQTCRFGRRDGGGAAAKHAYTVSAPKMHESRACYGGLVAMAHVERVDAFQVHKRRIRDHLLIAVEHFKIADALKVHKSRVRYL